MSTTFGIYKGKESITLVDDDLPADIDMDDFVKVAFRGNLGGFSWKNDVAEFLPDELKVYPLDNTAQGVYTIGDIKHEMHLQNIFQHK